MGLVLCDPFIHDRVDPMAGYDPARLRRAARLWVKRVGEGMFQIEGKEQPHYDVDLNVDPPCYCKDSDYRMWARGKHCKHALAARLASGDMALIHGLADMIVLQERRKNEADSE